MPLILAGTQLQRKCNNVLCDEETTVFNKF